MNLYDYKCLLKEYPKLRVEFYERHRYSKVIIDRHVAEVFLKDGSTDKIFMQANNSNGVLDNIKDYLKDKDKNEEFYIRSMLFKSLQSITSNLISNLLGISDYLVSITADLSKNMDDESKKFKAESLKCLTPLDEDYLNTESIPILNVALLDNGNNSNLRQVPVYKKTLNKNMLNWLKIQGIDPKKSLMFYSTIFISDQINDNVSNDLLLRILINHLDDDILKKTTMVI